ncbi:MAG: hypothetical protein GEU78_13840 [Actinobacteria bacterium]|nr:hypothetical protein [Actinomycetota bacterium]
MAATDHAMTHPAPTPASDMATQRSVESRVADVVAWTSFEDLPEDVVEASKRSILDTLGVTLAATTLAGEDVLAVARLAQEWGGTPESTVVGSGDRAPAYLAAFVFGALGHALDYDDLAQEAVAHPTLPTIAAAFPLAERLGHVDGKSFVTATAIGVDLVIRLGLSLGASPVAHGWLPSTAGVFGATVASAKLLGLSPVGVGSALGLSLHQASGSAQCAFGTGSSFRAIRDGFNAKAGILSALLSELGAHGDQEALEGRFGFLNLHFRGDYDRDVILDGLGRRFLGTEIGYKAWPCCGYSQFFLTALKRLIDRHDLAPEDVEQIVAVGGDELLTAQCEPLEERVSPSSSIDAKFSLPFQLGKLLAGGQVRLDDFTAKGRADARAIAIARKVSWRVDPEGARGKFGPGIVEVHTGDGQVLVERADYALGHPCEPLTWEQLEDKFRDCIAHARVPLQDRTVDEAIRLVRGIENVADVSSIMRLLSPAPSG